MIFKKPFHLTCIMLLLASGINFSYGQTISGTYTIKNVKTGVVLRPLDADNKNGVPIIAYSHVNWKCVTWNFLNVGDKTYQLQNLFTNKTFDNGGLNPVDGDSLKQVPVAANKSSQVFEFIPVQKNCYIIRLKNTELYITPSDTNATINAPVLLKKRNNSDTQLWTLVEQHPTM